MLDKILFWVVLVWMVALLVMAVPSGLLAGAPVMAAVGATLVTLTAALAVPTPPSLSVTVRLTA